MGTSSPCPPLRTDPYERERMTNEEQKMGTVRFITWPADEIRSHHGHYRMDSFGVWLYENNRGQSLIPWSRIVDLHVINSNAS